MPEPPKAIRVWHGSGLILLAILTGLAAYLHWSDNRTDSASIQDERPAPRIIGLVTLADCATPPTGIGGKDWRIEVKDADGKSDAFAVSYNGASYAVKIDTAKLPTNKAVSLTLWDGDTADRIIEGVNPSRSMVLDVCFSRGG